MPVQLSGCKAPAMCSRCCAVDVAEPSPPTPITSTLPADLLARIVSLCDSPLDIVRTSAVSHLFRDSVTEDGIRLRAQERGYEALAPAEGERCPLQRLCLFAMLRESNQRVRLGAGNSHSVFIDNEGRLLTCGKAKPWQPALLGHPRPAPHESVIQIMIPTRVPSLLGGERAVTLAVGAKHSIAITTSGALWSWGDGKLGTIGHDEYTDSMEPTKIAGFAGRRVVAASAGDAHNLAITADASAWSWGRGYSGRLGHGGGEDQLRPKRIEALVAQRIIAVAAGGDHCLAVTADGKVYSWGRGECGQLGHGKRSSERIPDTEPLPRRIMSLRKQRVIAVAAGGLHSLAVTADGLVWSWGAAGEGKLGHGTEDNQMRPKKIKELTGQRIVAVAAGHYHSFALSADGILWGWGRGYGGQLGHGDLVIPRNGLKLPRRVEAFAGRRVVAVTAAGNHSLAQTSDGAFWGWGEGDNFAVGQGEDTSNIDTPRRIEIV